MKLQTRVIDLYKEGLSFRDIGKQLGISHEKARQLWNSVPVSNPQLTGIDTSAKIGSKETEVS